MESKRYKSITITLNEEEREIIKKRAKQAKLTMSGYCRYVLLGGAKQNEKQLF